MAVHPRGGKWIVYVYDPAIKRKRYVGTCVKKRGPGGADELFRQKTAEFQGKPVPSSDLTCRDYSEEWLRLHHGEGTRRPARRTWENNRSALNSFLEDFGDRAIDGGIARREALAWARKHPKGARSASAMFFDAIDDEVTRTNPFANRRQQQSRERKHIHPLTEKEVDQLAGIALKHFGEDGYGLVARAWVLFAAWVGCRPGETFRVTADDLDFRAGLVKIRRVKKRGGSFPVDVVVFPKAAQDAVRAMPELAKSGPIFTTMTGRPVSSNMVGWYWDPIRITFRQKVTDERWAELLDGSDSGKTLDFYVMRHFCASLIVARGGNEYDVAAQLGNSPEVARATYIHSYREERNDRNRRFLEGARVVDLASRRGSDVG